MAAVSDKKTKGQFYTVNHAYILTDMPGPPEDSRCIIEPFAGKGDLLDWVLSKNTSGLPIEAYDIDPKRHDIIMRDTLLSPPNYHNAWILTNPPYLARNKSVSKTVFDMYDTNDLYKCFIMSLVRQSEPARGGIMIIPAGFFLSPRDIDVRVRSAFLERYRVLRVRYFEETVFPDTTTTVVAVAFERIEESATAQVIPWQLMPTGTVQEFTLCREDAWIVGGDIYRLTGPAGVEVRRWVVGGTLKPGEQLTELTLSALDSGRADGRIELTYRAGYCYPAKDSSRTYATLCVRGRRLTVDEQRQVAMRFNGFLEARRAATWSLFLPQYRESKEYARKRIPFELAYRIVEWIIGQLS